MRTLIILFVLSILVSPASRADETDGQKGFIAYTPHPMGTVDLDFMEPPDFVFQFYDMKVGMANYFTTRDIKRDGLVTEFEYIGRKELDEGGTVCRVYSYRTRGPGPESFQLEIWTDIQSISQEDIDSMKIDRKPFCIVIMLNQAGAFRIPLNDATAPSEEWFTYINYEEEK
jgi:hypothetical protein